MPQNERLGFGVDVGGTWIRCGVISSAGRLITERAGPTACCKSRDDFLSFIETEVRRARGTLDRGGLLDQVGIGVPGTLDGERRQIVRSVNLPFLEGWALCDAAGSALGVAARLLTDAEASTWGEYTVHRRSVPRFAHLRLGTGIALGVVADGRLVRLDLGRRDHLEVLVVDRTAAARACGCGLRGCLETVASGPALSRAASAVGLDSVRSIQRAWDRGVPAAIHLVEEAARSTVAALDNIVARFEPRIVTLGGGVAAHLPALLCRVLGLWHSGTRDDAARAHVTLLPAALGDASGVVGAGLLGLHPH